MKFVWMYWVNEDRSKLFFKERSSILRCKKCMLVFAPLNKFSNYTWRQFLSLIYKTNLGYFSWSLRTGVHFYFYKQLNCRLYIKQCFFCILFFNSNTSVPSFTAPLPPWTIKQSTLSFLSGYPIVEKKDFLAW